MMQKIVTDTDWNLYDKLNDIALSDGEELLIKFPNGDTLKKKIKIERTLGNCRSEDENGHFVPVTDYKAYIETTFKGFKIKIYVSGLYAERVCNEEDIPAFPVGA